MYTLSNAGHKRKFRFYQGNMGGSAPGAAFEFLREHWRKFLAISAAAVIPCFWHRHLEAGDLASHTYNAWLAQLIDKGLAPGLVLVRQSQNVLFDLTVSWLGNLFDLTWAEKIAVSMAVLTFFWGTFALACAVSHRQNPRPIPWFLASCIAVLAYGYTLEAGFINYYLSIGLAFWGLAVIGQSDVQSVGSAAPNGLILVLLIPVIWLANPLGLAVLLSGGAYILLAKLLPARCHLYLFVAAVLVVLALHFGIKFRHWDTPWFVPQVGHMLNGADQLLLGSRRYLIPVYLLEFLFIVSLLFDIVQGWRRRQWWRSYLLPVQLYSLSLITVLALPTGIVPPARFFGPMNALIFLKERTTSVVAVFACCLLAQIRPRNWHCAGFAVLAAIFFSNLYWDTGTISGVEDQVDNFVASIPFGRRVIEKTISLPSVDRVGMIHIIDRACIGRCFSYGNYEPSSRQFRIRSRSENPVVLTTNADIDAVRLGTYFVQPRDLPLYEIYQCEGTTVLCFRELHAGQVSGQIP